MRSARLEDRLTCVHAGFTVWRATNSRRVWCKPLLGSHRDGQCEWPSEAKGVLPHDAFGASRVIAEAAEQCSLIGKVGKRNERVTEHAGDGFVARKQKKHNHRDDLGGVEDRPVVL